MKTGKLLATTAAMGMAASLAQPLWAQDQSAQPAPKTAEEEVPAESVIIVTGSRISRPNLDSAVPITSVSVQELTSTGDVSLGDALNELPALRSTFSQSNSTRFIGTAGVNILDLRGLGTARTLVLVNGRRHVSTQPGNSNVDTNTIPTDLVERVDVVTGGNSAIYGSDAVAGVVNFVLKRDFEGIRLRGQGGISSRGDRGSYFTSLTAGKNFGEGRGNVAAAFEYSQSNALYYVDRDAQYGAFSGRSQFNITQNTLGEPSTGDGIPDNTFLRGVRNITISEGGAYSSACPADTPANAARRAVNCTGERGPALPGQLGPELGRAFVFDANGNLIPNNGTRDLRTVGSGNNINGIGSTLRLTGQLQPGVKRYAANIMAGYEIAEALRPFIEAKYVRIDAVQEGQPTFNNNTFSINNPFLTAQARALLVSSLAPGATTFAAQRFNVDFGGRGENHKRETFRVVAGVDGTFNDDWRYEVAFNYGRLDTYYETQGNVLLAQYANSINAVRNAAGQIVCGINADASTANDDAACVPVNLFGMGAPSQAALNYFSHTSSRKQYANQYNATAYVSGDLSQVFELPGGPVGFAIGAEYRRETSYSEFDAITRSGATFLNAIPIFDPPALEVKEVFGEIRVPILANVPFAQELTLEASGRVSDYNIGSTGTVFAYNIGGIWAPIPDVRFRAGYAHSVRAPTQSDLFAAPSQTFLNGLVDPCGQQNINNNPNRVANCAAAGVPTTQTFTGTTEPFTNRPASGILGLNGSNPNLSEEKGTSWTAGVVIQPRAIPGLSLSIDYYNIKIDQVIFSLAAQTIINQCYDSPSGINNPFCAAITRNPNGTFAGQSDILHGGTTVSFPRTGTSFLSGPFNFAKQKTSGIDLDLNYRTAISDGITFSMRGILSYLIERDNYTDINRPDFIDQQKLELGDPEWESSLNANLDFGVFDFNYNMRYIGKQTIGTFEAQNSLQGRPPENPDQFPFVFYPHVTYHNFRIGMEPGERFRFYAGVDNAFDRHPPFGLDGTGGGSGIYENVGRFFYLGAEVKF
ncbi:MAG: TonB-dependent receptor domain-containing protein [Sphingomonadaceae bacterium]